MNGALHALFNVRKHVFHAHTVQGEGGGGSRPLVTQGGVNVLAAFIYENPNHVSLLFSFFARDRI